jgi:D-alanyl-lipoteichoic acid acyltransferase DltB (MBOAT superfamily)
MTLTHIVVFTAAGIFIGLIKNYAWRSKLLLLGSLLSVYWLQPASSIRYLEFWLPTLMIGLIMIVYGVCFPQNILAKQNMVENGMIVGVPLFVGITRYFGPSPWLTSSLPPRFISILGWLAVFLVLLGLVVLSRGFSSIQSKILFLGIILVLIFIKNDVFAETASGWLRNLSGQNPNLASASDLVWLGYSYVAFRLLHIIRDNQNQRLPDLNMVEFSSYIVFFPSFTAGPIDRVDQFADKLRENIILNSTRFINGAERLAMGLFKKFVLADSLALLSLSSQNAAQIANAQWGWVALYAYAFRILLDFSGYTDIAIGIGIFVGVQLPENFRKPYLQPNLTKFWNNWHITLTQWFRAYFFNPLTRALRSGNFKISLSLIILLGQFSTMVLIGLWHGIAWNFVIWGAWHGFGLFFHNRWGAFVKNFGAAFFEQVKHLPWLGYLGTVITFNYVALGWIWFVIPTPEAGWRYLGLLFGG